MQMVLCNWGFKGELLKLFDIVCKKRRLMVNLGKSKEMVCVNTERRDHLNLSLNGEMVEEADSFKYLGSIIGKNEGVFEDEIGRVNKGAKVSGPMNQKGRLNVTEMKFLGSISGVTKIDRITNKEIMRRAGVESDLSWKEVQTCRKKRNVKRVYYLGVEGRQGRGRPNRV